jgi:hypothetical protein
MSKVGKQVGARSRGRGKERRRMGELGSVKRCERRLRWRLYRSLVVKEEVLFEKQG